MASKRNLKKSINTLADQLLTECFAFNYFHPDSDPKKIRETMWAVVHTRNEMISRINRQDSPIEEEKSKNRLFYKTLNKDLCKMPALLDHLA